MGSVFSALEVLSNLPIGRVPGDLTTCVKLGYPAFRAPGTPFLSVDLLCEIKGLVSGILEISRKIRSNQSGKLHQVRVLRHIRYKYACKKCKGVDSEGSVVKVAPPAVQLIPKSMASAGLLAYVVSSKYEDALPF
jgi:hypothetical protein